jgi:hypothetical protein
VESGRRHLGDLNATVRVRHPTTYCPFSVMPPRTPRCQGEPDGSRLLRSTACPVRLGQITASPVSVGAGCATSPVTVPTESADLTIEQGK